MKKRKTVPLTLEQARHLIATARGHRLEAFVAVAVVTGMRHGELAALRWEDVDLERGAISVHRTVGHLGKLGFVEGDPKTESSERMIPISQTICTNLKAHRVRQSEARLAEKAGLPPDMRIHDLRHTASTLLQSIGVSPKVVQEILGHSQLEQTGNYTHVLVSMQKEASEKMDILFQKPS